MDRNHFLHLTEQGKAVAETIYERHRFFTEELIEAGVDPKQAETEACRIEHCISDESFLKLQRKMPSAPKRSAVLWNELAVKQAIANLLKEKKTVVMIAHTLSIVKNADQILVMGDGRIAESGTHEELLAKGGKYAVMWNAEQKISA